MSLTRFLPNPSDRMGIIWSLLPIDGSVVLEYGPAGTTHYSMGLYGELGENQQNKLFTTHMSEDDVVMGDVTRLENAITEIDRNLQPKVIFVVASSVAAVIGTDIRGVCTYMQQRVNAHLVSFEQGGFRGDYSVGIAETCKMLVNEITVPACHDDMGVADENTVNLIGFSMGAYRAASDRQEWEDLLMKAFGLHIGACLGGETSVTAIENMGNAALNIVAREEGIPAAKILQSRFGTPTVAGTPYGYKGTLEFLEKIEKAIGRKMNPKVRMELMERLGDSAYYPMYAGMLKYDKPSVVLYGEYRTVLGIGNFLTELGLKPSKIICKHSLKCIPNPDPAVTVCQSEKERLDIMKDLHRSFILADDATMSVCPADNTFLRITMPVVRGAQVARHMPLIGIKGADFILEAVEEYYQLIR